MRFYDVIETLRGGYLSGHGSSLMDAHTELPIGYDRYIALTNAGIIELYKRFLIRKEEVVIQCVKGVERYPIRESSKYIDGYVMVGEINAILEIYDDEGKLCTINNLDNTNAKPKGDGYGINVTLQAHNILGVPKDYAGTLRIIYKAGGAPMHTKGDAGAYLDPYEVFIDLPNMYMEALCLYVASRMFSVLSSNSPRGQTTNPIQMFSQMYEAECQALKAQGADRDLQRDPADSFTMKGFV